MIKNIVFDIGNVLMTFKPDDYLRTVVSDENKRDLLYKTVFCGQEWIMLDKGTIDEKSAIDSFIEKSPQIKNDILELMDTLYEKMIMPLTDTIDYLKELRKSGYKIYLLSNYHDRAFDYIDQQYGLASLVDGKIISARVQMLKPDAKIYIKLLQTYNLIPEETVFIDDMIENVRAAEALGIKSFQFTDCISLKKNLCAFLSAR